MHEKHFYKTWFTFPFCINVDDCYRFDYKKELSVHFLWWHFRWFVGRRRNSNG